MLARVGPGQTGLQVTNDAAELARCEESRPERSRPVLTDRRKGPQRSANLGRHVLELPAHLVLACLGAIRISKSGGSDRIGGGPQRVCAHVADGDGLTGGPRRSRRGRGLHVVRRDATGKATADLLPGAELTAGEGARSGDESPRAIVVGSLSLEMGQNPFCAVGGPCGNQASVGFAQCLWRWHDPPVRGQPDGPDPPCQPDRVW